MPILVAMTCSPEGGRMRLRLLLTALAGAGALAASTTAFAAMHPELGAKLSGMGEHGIVNIQSHEAQGKICWTFELTAKGLTGATIRDTHGMIVAHLGMHYEAKGCDAAPTKALTLIESKPSKYAVWVATKTHPGELRGTLFAGMAHM
jgi:hypothetical protein